MQESNKKQEVDRAIQTIKEGDPEAALEVSMDLRDRDKDYVLWHIVECHAESEQFERAKQAFEMMATVEEDDDKWQAVQDIAYGYASAGEFDNALQFARNLEENYYKAESLSSIAWRYAEIEDFVNAFAIAHESEELNPGFIEETLDGIIELAAKSLEALKVEDAIAATQEIQSEDYQIYVLQYLARNYAEKLQRDRLLKIAQLTTNKKIKLIAANCLVPDLIISDKVQEAKAILHTLGLEIDPKYLDEMLRRQAFKLYFSGKTEEAIEILQLMEDPAQREKALAGLEAQKRRDKAFDSLNINSNQSPEKSYWRTYYFDS